MKYLLFIASIISLFACSSNHRKFENISDVKDYAESKGYKVLFETDSTLTYLSTDTVYFYDLEFDNITKFTEDNINYRTIQLDFTKLYPMSLNYEAIRPHKLGNMSLFKALISLPVIIKNNNGLIFKTLQNSDEYGEIENYYQFSINPKSDENFKPQLTDLGSFVNIKNGNVFVEIISNSFPNSFKNALAEILSEPIYIEKLEDGVYELVSTLSMTPSGNILSLEPSNLWFGEINIPIYEYGNGKDLLQAIEASL